MALLDRGEDFVDCEPAIASADFFTKFIELIQRIPVSLHPRIVVGRKTGNGAAVAQDHDRPAALDFVKKLGEMQLCDGGLHLDQIAAIKWSNVLGKVATTRDHFCHPELVDLTGQFRPARRVESRPPDPHHN